jgi:hypothetical protein
LRVVCTGYAVDGEGKCPHRPGSCLANEEMMLGVCYKKCSILTNQEFPHRVAPATCCKAGGISCLLFPWKSYTSKEYAVGGGRSGPGACSQDAEMFMGLCYKKCALLTEAKYPHRLGPLTCCGAYTWYPHMGDGAWHMGCLDLRKDHSRPSFAAADLQPSVNYSSIHWPLADLTEESNDGHVQPHPSEVAPPVDNSTAEQAAGTTSPTNVTGWDAPNEAVSAEGA